MNALVQAIIEWVRLLWPFALIDQWEQGVYYVCGHSWKVVGPGVYPVLPWFMEIRAVTMAPAILQTERIDVTLHDGSIASFAATATVRVIDPKAALNKIDNYHEATLALIASSLADRIARVDVARLEADKRPRLATDLARWITEEAREFGVEVTKVRFTSFIRKVRVYRLLNDGMASNVAW